MSRGRFVARRTVFLLSLAAALAFVLAVGVRSGKATLPGPGGGACSGQYGGMSASRTLDGTVVSATWCWNAGEEITSVTWSQYEENPWPLTGYCPWQIKDVSQSAYMWQFKATETLDPEWYSGCPVSACWAYYTLKATIWTPPSPNMGLTDTGGGDYGCACPIICPASRNVSAPYRFQLGNLGLGVSPRVRRFAQHLR